MVNISTLQNDLSKELSDKDKKVQTQGRKETDKRDFKQHAKNLQDLRSSHNVPSSLDWRDCGVLTPVKDQGRTSCGSCWAFAATATMEAALAIHGLNKCVSLSEQQILDCQSLGTCSKGGELSYAGLYIAENNNHTLSPDSIYPYTGNTGICQDKSAHSQVKVNMKWTRSTPGDEEELKTIIATVGPVFAAIEADETFQAHRPENGIFYNPNCTNKLNHAVVIIGYGTTKHGKDFWRIRNSWGPFWCNGGHIEMARNQGNNCGIATEAYYPTIVSEVQETEFKIETDICPTLPHPIIRDVLDIRKEDMLKNLIRKDESEQVSSSAPLNTSEDVRLVVIEKSYDDYQENTETYSHCTSYRIEHMLSMVMTRKRRSKRSYTFLYGLKVVPTVDMSSGQYDEEERDKEEEKRGRKGSWYLGLIGRKSRNPITPIQCSIYLLTIPIIAIMSFDLFYKW